MCANAAARSSVTSKSSPTMPRTTVSTSVEHLLGPGGIDHAGKHLVHRRVGLAGRELTSRLLGLPVHPRAQQVEAPERTGDGVGSGVRPQVGDDAQTLFVGEVQDAGDETGVGLVVRTTHQQMGDAVTGGGELGRVGVLGLGLEDLGAGQGRTAIAGHGCIRSLMGTR